MTAINPNILKELDTAIALRTNKIGKSRKNDKLLIFEGPDDPVLVDNKIALDSYIDQYFVLLRMFADKAKEFEFVIELSQQSLQKELEKKKMSFKVLKKW